MAVASIAAMLAALAGCVVPPSPDPSVRPQPDGRGIVSGVDVAASAGCSAALPGAPPAGTSTLTVPWQGATRAAVVRVPGAAASAGPRPLLVSLHPFTQGPDAWEEYSGLAEAAVARGYVVASPLGSDPGPRWAVPGGLPTGADDIGFVAALADYLEDHLCIDRNAEFAAGYSAGAAMAQALSCTMPWRFAAVAGSGGVNLTATCPASPPTDVFVLHGSADPIAPPTGSQVIFAPPLGLSVGSVVASDAARAGCDPTPGESSPAPQVAARTFTGCAHGARVQYWEMQDTGHTWSGAEPFPFDLVVGPTLGSFSATEVVLDFFDAA